MGGCYIKKTTTSTTTKKKLVKQISFCTLEKYAKKNEQKKTTLNISYRQTKQAFL